MWKVIDIDNREMSMKVEINHRPVRKYLFRAENREDFFKFTDVIRSLYRVSKYEKNSLLQKIKEDVIIEEMNKVKPFVDGHVRGKWEDVKGDIVEEFREADGIILDVFYTYKEGEELVRYIPNEAEVNEKNIKVWFRSRFFRRTPDRINMGLGIMFPPLKEGVPYDRVSKKVWEKIKEGISLSGGIRYTSEYDPNDAFIINYNIIDDEKIDQRYLKGVLGIILAVINNREYFLRVLEGG